MGTAQLKKQLHEYIDKADERLLHLVYGLFQADMKEQDWWDEISTEEQAEIEEGLAQADRGELIPHEEVMAKYKKWL